MDLFLSILGCKSANINDFIDQFNPDGLHIDIMDGHAVPNLGFPPWIIPLLKPTKPIHVHLMVKPVEQFLQMVCDYNPEAVFFHPTWAHNPHHVLEYLKMRNIKGGIVWNDDDAAKYFSFADVILFMTVNPGYAGQKMLLDRIPKIHSLVRQHNLQHNLPFWIDGGINADFIHHIKDLNPNGIVVGSGIASLKNIKLKQ